MEVKEILSKCDHTLLAQTATWKEIQAICDDGMKYGCASVCIPASYVKQAAEYVAGKLPICTVIGFPNGYDTTAAKCFMATDAVENGAEEVDMVINLGWVKDQKWDDLLAEIKAVKAACKGRLLKVIIECCFLTDEEKIKMCEIVTAVQFRLQAPLPGFPLQEKSQFQKSAADQAQYWSHSQAAYRT